MCVGCVGRGHSFKIISPSTIVSVWAGCFFFGKKNKKYNGSIPVSGFEVLGLRAHCTVCPVSSFIRPTSITYYPCFCLIHHVPLKFLK